MEDLYGDVRVEAVRDGACRVVMSGEFDRTEADALALILQGLAAVPGLVIEVDVTATTFMGAAAARAMAESYELAQASGSTLVVVGASATVRRLFTIVGLPGVVRRQLVRADAVFISASAN